MKRVLLLFAALFVASATVAEATAEKAAQSSALFFQFEPTTAEPGDRVTVRTGGTPQSFEPSQRVKPLQQPIRLYLVPDAIAPGVRSRFDPRLHFVGALVPDRRGRGVLTFRVPPLDADSYAVAAWCPGCASSSGGRKFFVVHVGGRTDIVPRYRRAMLLRVEMPAEACPATIPNGDRPLPGLEASPGWHGNGFLWTSLPLDGVFTPRPEDVGPDGSITTKWFWLAVGVDGSFTVKGQRVDARSPPLRVHRVNRGWPTGFRGSASWATTVTFPSVGCWRITARVEDVSLSFVLEVVAVATRSAERLTYSARDPTPLRGIPLRGGTGLRLVVADNPPFVLDVDTGSVTPVSGVPQIPRGTLSVVEVAGRAAVVVARSHGPRADLYAVRGRGAQASSLGTGSDVWPAANGRAVWVQSFVGRSRCALRQVGLDGRKIRSARAFPCASGSDRAGGSLGLVVRRARILDPFTGRRVFNARWGILAVAGQHVLLAGPDNQFTLIDAATRAQRRLPWPSCLGGLDRPAVDPRGRFVALAFANPAWDERGQQVTDVWLLDTETAKLTQLPGMPAFVSLKRTSMAWTHDGRLVLLGESGGNDVVAVWRPGQKRLATKTVDLPVRSDSGSDSFAPLHWQRRRVR